MTLLRLATTPSAVRRQTVTLSWASGTGILIGGWFGLAQRGSVVHHKSFADGGHGGKRKVLDVAFWWIRAD